MVGFGDDWGLFNIVRENAEDERERRMLQKRMALRRRENRLFFNDNYGMGEQVIHLLNIHSPCQFFAVLHLFAADQRAGENNDLQPDAPKDDDGQDPQLLSWPESIGPTAQTTISQCSWPVFT